MTTPAEPPPSPVSVAAPAGQRLNFADDFRRFFLRGLAALLPTLLTIGLVVWIWNFLWNNLGQYVILGLRWGLWSIYKGTASPWAQRGYVYRTLNNDEVGTRLLGVSLAVLLIYVVGVFVGNLIGRTAWRLAEVAVMKVPVVSAIYPAVKQITDFLLSERTDQFQGSAVVAVEPHEKGIWSIGLVTGPGLSSLTAATGQAMITVFVPSSPTAFSGYVLVVPRASVIELPLKVEEAMRLLVSGGVITPEAAAAAAAAARKRGGATASQPVPRAVQAGGGRRADSGRASRRPVGTVASDPGGGGPAAEELQP